MRMILVATEGGVARLETSDDITLVDFLDRNDPLGPLLGPAAYCQRVLVDLSKSCYMDSAGVGWLLECHNHFQRGGGKLVIHSIPPMVHHVFRVLGLYDVLCIAANEEEAMKRAGVVAARAS